MPIWAFGRALHWGHGFCLLENGDLHALQIIKNLVYAPVDFGFFTLYEKFRAYV